jgi:uncharacterized protein YgfB (UPF0149 family)
MFDESNGEGRVFDFDEFADHLLEQGLQASPAQLHGCISGMICAGGVGEPEAGLAALCQALDLSLHGELAGQAMELYKVSGAAMLDEEFDFHPLLPDDESTDIEVRTSALAAWCSGFLAGFAQAGTGAGRSTEALSSDTGEILADFAAIAEAGVDEEAQEDESEEQYFDIVEYVRFATLNVFMDCVTGADQPDPAPGSGVH